MKKKKKPKYMSPFRADTTNRVCMLNRDNVDTDNGWILVNGDTVSVGQRSENTGRYVTLPRAEFARLARWFFTEQKLRQDNGEVPRG